MKHELVREKEYRQIVEKRLQDNQNLAMAESATMQQEIQDLQKRITTLQHDCAQVTAEKESLLKSLSNKRIEIDSYVARTNLMSEEHRNLSSQIDRLHHQIALTENCLATSRQEKEDQLRQHEQYVMTLTNQSKEQIKDLQENQSKVIEKLKIDHDISIRQCQEKLLQVEKKLATQQYEEELNKLHHRDHESEIARLKQLLCQQEDETKYFKQTIEDKEKSFKEEKIETEAIKLRMKAQDQQLLELQQELRSTRQQQSQQGLKAHFPMGSNPQGIKSNRTRTNQADTSLVDFSIEVPPSPMFSDDFNPGTLSIPASPMVSFTPQLQQYFPNNNQPTLPTVTEQPDSLQSERSFFGVAPERDLHSNMDTESKKITQENERLKAVIKEVSLFAYLWAHNSRFSSDRCAKILSS
jgi:myosin heavy subunit